MIQHQYAMVLVCFEKFVLKIHHQVLGCIFLFQEYPFLGPCFSFLPGFLRIPQDSFFSGGIFSQEPRFGRGKKIPVFGLVYRNFTQVPVNSCI